jgi:hypothetical protein
MDESDGGSEGFGGRSSFGTAEERDRNPIKTARMTLIPHIRKEVAISWYKNRPFS